MQNTLWLDLPDFHSEASRRTEDSSLAAHAQEMAANGLTVLRQAVPSPLCDRAYGSFKDFCGENAHYSRSFADSQGHYSRVNNLHLKSSAALEIGLNSRTLQVLDFLFGARAAIFTSLTFEVGTEQTLHRDAPFFFTQPENLCIAAWTALEDILPESGPLIYIPKGHRLPVDHEAIAEKFRAEKSDRYNKAFTEYCLEVEKACYDRGLSKESLALQKGDTVLWHALLPHGGSPIQDRRLTRKSIVFHMVPEDIPIFGVDCFFYNRGSLPSSSGFRSLRHAGRQYIDHGAPYFETKLTDDIYDRNRRT